MSETATIRVPASTSNCGPGFDTLGLALNLYNTVSARRLASGEIVSENGPACPALQMVREAAAAFFGAAQISPFGFSYSIKGDVPPARGLGSSVTVRAGVIAALNEISGAKQSRRQIAALVSKIEGHPDNAVAACLGGFVVPRCDPSSGDLTDVIRFELPSTLVFVVASPGQEMLTKESRAVLPAQVSLADAARNVNSVAFIVAAFATGDYGRLRGAISDFLHEPYRLPKIPRSREAMQQGIDAGAYAAWLSGSGSSLLCVSEAGVSAKVAAAMRRSLEHSGVTCECRELVADNAGYQVL